MACKGKKRCKWPWRSKFKVKKMVLLREVTLRYTCISGCKLNSCLIFFLNLRLALNLSYADKHKERNSKWSVNPEFIRPQAVSQWEKNCTVGKQTKVSPKRGYIQKLVDTKSVMDRWTDWEGSYVSACLRRWHKNIKLLWHNSTN